MNSRLVLLFELPLVSDLSHEEVFAPTVNEKSSRLLFAICVFYGMMISDVDVKGTFLSRIKSSRGGVCCSSHHFLTRLSGLPDSPQAGYNDVATVLLSNGCTCAVSDPCVFITIRSLFSS
jgi:hypothetical protein